MVKFSQAEIPPSYGPSPNSYHSSKIEIECYKKYQKYFQDPDQFSNEVCTQVVYKFTCPAPGDPDTTYIGRTNRSLRERVTEHLNIKKCTTAVSEHISQCESCCNTGVSIDNFEIMRQCQQKWDTPVQEALLIKKETPKLNRQSLKSTGYSFTFRVYNQFCKQTD